MTFELVLLLLELSCQILNSLFAIHQFGFFLSQADDELLLLSLDMLELRLEVLDVSLELFNIALLIIDRFVGSI